jgi:hypothetical protein
MIWGGTEKMKGRIKNFIVSGRFGHAVGLLVPSMSHQVSGRPNAVDCWCKEKYPAGPFGPKAS